MKPAPFDYMAPTSLDETLDILQEYGAEAKLLAGGQSLIPVMNFRLAQPALLVDLNNLSALSHLAVNSDGGLSIGAMARQRRLERSPLVADHAPLICEAMPHIAHPQIRNRGTVGGSLAHADPAAELPLLAVVLGAKFRLQRQGSERWIDANSFYDGLFTTTLAPEEILTEIAIPPLLPHMGFAFQELARRHGDYAQAGVAVQITLDENQVCRQASLGYLSVGDGPMMAENAASLLVGETFSDALISDTLIEEVAQAAAQNEIEPTDDVHASAGYKRHLAVVLGRRAILQAVARAKKRVTSYE